MKKAALSIFVLLASSNFAHAGWGVAFPNATPYEQQIFNDQFFVDGQDAEELFNFLPFEAKREYRCLQQSSESGKSDGHPSSIPGCDRRSKTQYVERKEPAGNRFVCTFVNYKKETSHSCVFKFPLQVLGSPFPFVFGGEYQNNMLGKILNGNSFASSSGLVALSCQTISANRYYDCFVTLNP